MKMKTAFDRAASFVLAFCMMLTAVLPASAADFSSEDFAFTQRILKTDTVDDKMTETTEGKFFKDGQKLYVDAATILAFGEITGEIDSSGNYKSFSRKDSNNVAATFNASAYDTVTFEGVTYYPYTEALQNLCISAQYDSKEQTLVLTEAKSLAKLPDQLKKMNSNKFFSNDFYRDSKVFNYTGSNILAHGMDIALHLPVNPLLIVNKMTGVDSYERYREAVWKILIPDYKQFRTVEELDECEESLKNYAEWIKHYSSLAEAGETLKQEFVGLELFSKMVGSLDAFLQNKDIIECYIFYSQIKDMNKNLANGLTLIRNSGPLQGDQMDQIIRDTADVYEGVDTLDDLIAKQYEQGGLEAVTSFFEGDVRYKILEEGMNGILGTYDQLEATMEVYANMLLQDKANSSFKVYYNIQESEEIGPTKYIALKNMRDVMTVYLMACYNAYSSEVLTENKALTEDFVEYCYEKLGMKVSNDRCQQELLSEIKAALDYLMDFDDIDFTVYADATASQHSILANAAHRGSTHYQFKWDPSLVAFEATLEGADAKGIPFRYEYSFIHIYKLSNGLQAGFIRTVNNDTGSVSLKVYDFEGSCALVLRPVRGGTAEDVGLISTSHDGFYAEDYRQSDGSYRIPLPFDKKVQEAPVAPAPTEPKAPTVQEPPTAANNQFIYSTSYADYRITFDADVFLYKKGNYGFAFDVLDNGDEKHTEANVSASNQAFSFDLYYRERWADYNPKNNSGEYIGKSISQPVEVTLDNGMIARYFDIVNVSGKMENSPVYTDRYFHIDLGNGEGFFCQDYNYEKREAIHGLSYDAALKKAFLNIEIFPKPDAPPVYGQGTMILKGEKGTYKLTCDPTNVLLYADRVTDLYFTYKDGVEGELDGNVRSTGYFTSDYRDFDAYLNDTKDYFTNQFKKAQNVVFGEPGEFKAGDFVVKYLPVTYYNAARELQFNEERWFYIDFGNGEALTGYDRTTALHGDTIGYSGDKFLKEAFASIEIIK